MLACVAARAGAHQTLAELGAALTDEAFDRASSRHAETVKKLVALARLYELHMRMALRARDLQRASQFGMLARSCVHGLQSVLAVAPKRDQFVFVPGRMKPRVEAKWQKVVAFILDRFSRASRLSVPFQLLEEGLESTLRAWVRFCKEVASLALHPTDGAMGAILARESVIA